MDTFDAIRQRRAVKIYDPAHEMPQEKIDELLSLTRLAPTAFNLQNYRFVLARDPLLREKIREAAHGQPQTTDASLLIVICGDMNAWDKDPVRYWSTAPEDVQAYMKTAIDNYYRGKEGVQRDEAMRSAGIAAQTIMLAAKAMGYDSCPMDGFDFDAVARLIDLPEDHVVTMMVAVGRAAAPPQPRPAQLPLDELVVIDRFED